MPPGAPSHGMSRYTHQGSSAIDQHRVHPHVCIGDKNRNQGGKKLPPVLAPMAGAMALSKTWALCTWGWQCPGHSVWAQRRYLNTRMIHTQKHESISAISQIFFHSRSFCPCVHLICLQDSHLCKITKMYGNRIYTQVIRTLSH